MLWLTRVDLLSWSYVTAKVWIGVVVILPMEICDIYPSHLGGKKTRFLTTGDDQAYERIMDLCWLFLRITEPIVVILGPSMFVIAIAKPF